MAAVEFAIKVMYFVYQNCQLCPQLISLLWHKSWNPNCNYHCQSQVMNTKELVLGPSLSSSRATLPSILIPGPWRKVVSNDRTISQSSFTLTCAAPSPISVLLSFPVLLLFCFLVVHLLSLIHYLLLLQTSKVNHKSH